MEKIINFVVSNLDTIVTILITISGFIISYFMTQKSLKDEIVKYKRSIMADNLKELPFDICQLVSTTTASMRQNNSEESIENELLESFTNIMHKVVSYGSVESVKIAIYIREVTSEGATAEDKKKMLAAYSLLITQLKYDITGEIMPADSWFKIQINDYDENMRERMTLVVNNIIKRLNLNSQFTIM